MVFSILLMDSCTCVHRMNTYKYQHSFKHRLLTLEKSEYSPTAKKLSISFVSASPSKTHHYWNRIKETANLALTSTQYCIAEFRHIRSFQLVL